MNWYYGEKEHEQRMNDFRREAADARLGSEMQSVGDTSEKRSFPAKRYSIVLIFATIGHWLIFWRR